MRIGAIIAEYNPFHNGHKYQLEVFRKEANLDYILVLMSGNFVQRGEPAWMPKHLRAEMALKGGADCVIELPLYHATGSASVFAEGAIAHLEALGCIDALCFGCESNTPMDIHMSKLHHTADFLLNESEAFKQTLSDDLKQGFSYPTARAKAVQELCSEAVDLSKPNNILALEYLLALKRRNSSIVPMGIRRMGQGYHSTEQNHRFASASALREALNTSALSEPLIGLPEESLKIIQAHYGKALPMTLDDFSYVFASAFLSNKQRLTQYIDINTDIAQRMQKNFDSYTQLSDFLMAVKNKSLTYSRLSRCAIHLITQQYTDAFAKIYSDKKAYYTRILGFRRNASPMLKEIKQSTSIAMISKLSDYKEQLDANGRHMLEMDIAASELYRLTAQIKFGQLQKNAFTENIVILP